MKKLKLISGPVDLTRGPILSSFLRYCIPIILMGVLTMLYSSADAVVLGQFAGKLAFSAVGASAVVVALTVGTVVSINAGVSVLTARAFGAGDDSQTRRIVSTAFVFGIVLGLSIGALGIVLAPSLLQISSCPQDVYDQALLYLRIYFLGVPAQVFYTLMSPLLSARGDSARPLIFMAISGLTNVALNVLLVAVCSLDVVGVAVATVVSQYLSVLLLLIKLSHVNDCSRLDLRSIKPNGAIFLQMLRFGIPPTISSASFSITNFMIQSAINSFGQDGIAGNSAASNLESYVFTIINAFSAATVTAIGQNIGAGNFERVKSMRRNVYAVTFIIVTSASWMFILLGDPLLSIFIPGEPIAIDFGKTRLFYILSIVSLYAISAINGGIMQAFGKSGLQMTINLVFVCGLRAIWTAFIYPLSPSKFMLYFAYPLCYALIFIISIIAVQCIMNKYSKMSHLHSDETSNNEEKIKI